MDRPEAPLVAWGSLVMGVGGLVWTLTVVWGLVGSGTQRVQRARARLAYRTNQRDPRPGLAVAPWATAFALGFSAATLIPGASHDALFLAVSTAGLLIGGVALWRPGPFLPGWFREVERRRAAGLPLGVQLPPEGFAQHRTTPRDRSIVWACLTVGLVAGITLGFSLGYFSALALGAVQAFTVLASNSGSAPEPPDRG